MQQLHLVGFTTEHDALIFSARKGAKSGGFIVALDDALYDTIDEASRMQSGDGDSRKASRRTTPRPESALSPRDIQRRLRAGRTITSVASEAGVDEEWVMRFAVPILAEQALTIAKAQALVFSKARLGASGRPLGESVWWNVADKGALMAEDTFDQCWTALHLRDTSWIVRFDFINRKKRQRAEWEVDIREGTLTARNRLGSELGYIEPGRRGRPPALLPPAAKPVEKKAAPSPTASKGVAAKRPSPKRATAKRPAKKKKATTRRAAVKKAVKKKATARRPAKRTATKATKATKKRATAKRPAAKKTAARRPAAKKAAVKKSAAKKTAAKQTAARKPASKKKAAARKAAPKRSAGKRPAAKRQPAKRATRPRPLQAPAFETPEFDSGEATRPVTIRAPRAIEPETPPEAPVAEAEPEPVAPEPAPLPPPPVLTSTPSVGPRPEAPEQRRFSRLRRRRPPGG